MNKLLLKYTSYNDAAKANTLLFLLILTFSFGCTHTPNTTSAESNDPFESANRSVQTFNDAVDRTVAKPVAKGYTKITPEPAAKAVSNFFSNLGDPAVAMNQFLQGKFKLGVQDSARFVFNSTFGLGGLIDISTLMGLPKHEEDFGQTLAVWGVGSGAHLNIPLFGPTNFRDGVGTVVDTFAYPLGYLDDQSTRNVLNALLVTDKRASLLDAEDLITGDRYLFIRDAYNQRREFLIKDGEVEDAFLDDVKE